MKSLFLATLTFFVTQLAMASDLRIMKFDGKSTYTPSEEEKIQSISASNVDGTSIVTVITASTVCQILVSDVSEATSIVSAVSRNSILECYAREEAKRSEGRSQVLTREIRIIKGQ